MSGFDRSRIVDIKDQDLEEFVCGICRDVLNNPVVVQCCRQTYCKSCVDQWLKDYNTCPNDRQRLTTSGLSPAPRLVINFVNNMKIKCEKHSDGCPVVVSIGQIGHHMKNCQFVTCSKCGMRQPGEQHDCVHYLIATIQSLEDELFKWKSSKITSIDIIESARSNIDKCQVLNKSGRILKDGIADKIIEVCKKAIKSKNNYEDITKMIFEQLNKNPEGMVWQVIVLVFNDDTNYQGYYMVLKDDNLTLRFDRLIVDIFSAGKPSQDSS